MGIQSLGYVVIQTTVPDQWDTFLTDIVGARRAGQDGGAQLYRIDDRVFRFRIETGSEEVLVAGGFAVGSEAELDMLASKLRAAGHPVSPIDAASRGAKAAFRTTDPAGNHIELYHGNAKSDAAFQSPAGVSGFITGALGMGHVVVAAPNFAETLSFYTEILGLGKTDMPRFFLMGGPDDPGTGFAFLHGSNGRHHCIALGEMPLPPSKCIHIMLEMATMMDVGKCYDRMRIAKIPVSATLGRHVNDEMTSFYVQTPSGFDLEIGCDGLVIDPASWETTQHDRISEWGHVWSWQAAMEAAQG
jgi:3,4-dihydroxy-9,10-secoandrosta-1,3,5(10)-triene-9,17-dione 4,5-dioxygenase